MRYHHQCPFTKNALKLPTWQIFGIQSQIQKIIMLLGFKQSNRKRKSKKKVGVFNAPPEARGQKCPPKAPWRKNFRHLGMKTLLLLRNLNGWEWNSDIVAAWKNRTDIYIYIVLGRMSVPGIMVFRISFTFVFFFEGTIFREWRLSSSTASSCHNFMAWWDCQVAVIISTCQSPDFVKQLDPFSKQICKTSKLKQVGTDWLFFLAKLPTSTTGSLFRIPKHFDRWTHTPAERHQVNPPIFFWKSLKRWNAPWKKRPAVSTTLDLVREAGLGGNKREAVSAASCGIFVEIFLKEEEWFDSLICSKTNDRNCKFHLRIVHLQRYIYRMLLQISCCCRFLALISLGCCLLATLRRYVQVLFPSLGRRTRTNLSRRAASYSVSSCQIGRWIPKDKPEQSLILLF